jgi:MFS family permease
MNGGLLRQRDVRLIVGAVGISALGDFLAWIPLMLRMEEMSGSGIAASAVLIALWTPIVVLAPLAGSVVDRFENRRLLIVASLASAALAVGLALASDSVAGILIFATLLGVAVAFAQPAEFALVPVIAGEGPAARLNRLNGYVESARYTGMAVGPLLGGILSAAGGTKVALLVNAATFVVVALAALRLGARREPRVTAGAAGEDLAARAGGAEFAAQVEEESERARGGFALLFRDRTLGLVVGTAFVSLLFFTASATAEVFFAKDVLEVGDTGYGVLMSGWTVGMVVGAVLVAPRVPIPLLALGALVAIAVQGIGIGLPTVWLVFPFAVMFFSLGGAGHGTKNVLVRTLIQLRVADRLHGRAFAAYNGLRNGAELFALAGGGLLVSALGSRTTLALAGGIPLMTAVVGLVLYRRRTRVEPPPKWGEPVEPALADTAPASMSTMD